MSWRRRAIFVTVVLGVGVACFRPMMTRSIQHRFASELNTDARIENTSLSLQQSTVTLDGLSFEGSDSKVILDQLMLKLNAKELWYRNCIVDAMVGTGLRWYLPRPMMNSTTTATLDLSNAIGSHDVDDPFEKTKQTMENASKKLTAFETESSQHVLAIDSQIESIRSRVDDLVTNENLVNPLRPNDAIDQLRSDLGYLQQLLAETRIQSREIGKLVAESIQQSHSQLRPGNSSTVSEVQAAAIARQILDQTADTAIASVSPYLQASREFFVKLTPKVLGIHDAHSTSFHDGSDLVLEGLEPRKMKILRGKIEGVSVIEDRTEKTEIRIMTLANLPALSITWNGAAGTSSTSCVTQNSIESNLSQSFRLEQTVNSDYTLLLEKVVADQRLTQMEFPVQFCVESDLARQLGISQQLAIAISNSNVRRLITRTQIQGVDSRVPSTGWEWQPESTVWLASIVASALKEKSDEVALQSMQRASQWLSTERSQLDRRLAAIESTALTRKREWEQQFQNLTDRLSELEDNSRVARRAAVVR